MDLPDIKSVTFKSDIIDFRSLYRFIKTTTNAKINIDMGKRYVETWYSTDNYSKFFIWDNENSKLQAIRFDSCLISIVDSGEVLELNQNKEYQEPLSIIFKMIDFYN